MNDTDYPQQPLLGALRDFVGLRVRNILSHALVRTVAPDSATVATRVRLRRARGAVSAILATLVPLGGAMIIW
jgi:hypothetical protein